MWKLSINRFYKIPFFRGDRFNFLSLINFKILIESISTEILNMQIIDRKTQKNKFGRFSINIKHYTILLALKFHIL